MRVFELAGRPRSPEIERCYRTLGPGPDDYRQLATLLADEWSRSRPRLVGLGGGQGAGKSTLGRLIEQACALRGTRTQVLGLDDFYYGRAARRALGERVHPLLETRGPPGTHDMVLCRSCLHALLAPRKVPLPVFDKGRDDRAGSRTLAGPFDLVVLEGWCVGARPLPPDTLAAPINRLEREQDPEGIWRRHVADQLRGPYARLFAELDFLVFLQVPDLDAVRRWRLQQEDERPPGQRMSPEAVDRFVEHYARITLDMLARLPERADLVVGLDADHSIAELRFASVHHPDERAR